MSTRLAKITHRYRRHLRFPKLSESENILEQNVDDFTVHRWHSVLCTKGVFTCVCLMHKYVLAILINEGGSQ